MNDYLGEAKQIYGNDMSLDELLTMYKIYKENRKQIENILVSKDNINIINSLFELEVIPSENCYEKLGNLLSQICDENMQQIKALFIDKIKELNND